MTEVGDKVPSTTLYMMGPQGPRTTSTDEVFAPGKKVVAFALPGPSPLLEAPSMFPGLWPQRKLSRRRVLTGSPASPSTTRSSWGHGRRIKSGMTR